MKFLNFFLSSAIKLDRVYIQLKSQCSANDINLFHFNRIFRRVRKFSCLSYSISYETLSNRTFVSLDSIELLFRPDQTENVL